MISSYRYLLFLLLVFIPAGCSLQTPEISPEGAAEATSSLVVGAIDSLPEQLSTGGEETSEPSDSTPSTHTPEPTNVPTNTPSATPTIEPIADDPDAEATLVKYHTPTPTDTITPTPTGTPSETPAPPPTATPESVAAADSPTPGPAATACSSDEDCHPTAVPPIAALENTENILLLGTDRRQNDHSWRTDTVMLAAIDWENQRVGVLSFPRDLLIQYPWDEQRRINEVDFRGERIIDYPEGGFGLLKDVFLQNFGIRIDKAVRLHRSGFIELVDAVGGVDVIADCDLWELSPKPPGQEGYFVLHVPTGTHHFDGEDALKYATYRYATGDWDRRRRQQVVILALRDRALNLNLIPQIPHFIDILGRNFQTDINVLDLARYATFGLQLDMNNVRSRVLGRNETVKLDHPSGAYYLVSDGDKLFEAIGNIFDAAPIQEQVERPQGCPPAPGWAKDYMTPTPEGG